MQRQQGSVIIIVLWTSVLLTVLVTVMAGKVQLSAKTAFHNATAVTAMVETNSAMYRAEMELILEKMTPPIDQEILVDEDGNARIDEYRFNGQPLSLFYPNSSDMVVRIYDHAGKINLNGMPQEEMRLLIEHKLGESADSQRVQDLLVAWNDWLDFNDAVGINGAESEYYESLDPPYTSRDNAELDSVEELRLIRGFDELFKDVNLDAAFTVYGSTRVVNLNVATRDAMQLLPGLNDSLIEEIISYRERKDFRSKSDVGNVVPLENFVELSNWIGIYNSNYYSVFAYPKAQQHDPVTQAYMEILEVTGPGERARVYKVDPYGRLPMTSPLSIDD